MSMEVDQDAELPSSSRSEKKRLGFFTNENSFVA